MNLNKHNEAILAEPTSYAVVCTYRHTKRSHQPYDASSHPTGLHLYH
jgi:hypothetical protein